MIQSLIAQSTHFAELKREQESLIDWLATSALPLWADRGVDTENGGFYEEVAQDGGVIDGPRRTRLVSRQIFSFATAAEMGCLETTAATFLVNHGLDFLLEKCVAENELAYSVVTSTGDPIQPDFNLYDHAFALFALGTAARLGYRRQTATDTASAIRNAMVASWKHPWAGFEESLPRSEILFANQHMHLLEAFLEWEEIGETAVWQQLADEIAQLALSNFIDPDTGALRENYDRAWQKAPNDAGRLLEPGHHFEWAWLLWRWGLSRGRHDATSKAIRLANIGEDYGTNHKTGLAINEMWDDFSIRNDNCRLWPQTERIKAQIAMVELAQDADECNRSVKRLAEAARGLSRYFDTELAGLWHETLDHRGDPVPAPARASSLYHITCALRELDRFMKRNDEPD